MSLYAGVEMGGTKCICTLGSGPGEILAQEQMPTREPGVTLPAIDAILARWQAHGAPLAAIGIASFGPLDLRRESRSYGHICATPKQAWAHSDLLGYFQQRFAIPVGISTDVIGAALAEGRWGAAQGLADHAYITVGTGVGVGLVSGGRPTIGVHHPELGHVRVARAPGDSWPGSCRFHGDCVEGLASGPAIEARTGVAAQQLAADDPVWEQVAHTLGQLAHWLVLSVAPQRILIGGGVISERAHLFPAIRRHLVASLNGYIEINELGRGLDAYIVPPGLGAQAGPLGALAVAAETHEEQARATAGK